MRETVEMLLFVAFVGMLLLLRLDAYRFGAAEYDDELRHGGWRGWLRRITWYSLAIALVLVIYSLYPQPISVLHLDLGPDRSRALFLGLAFGIGGTVAAFVFAWLRYRRFRLPAARLYPGALINSLGTAFVDEALFRGMLLGILLQWSMPFELAMVGVTIVYALTTRLASAGRSMSMLVIVVVIGIVGAVLVNETLGIGAAVLGHAIARFAIFLATGHPGQVRPPGWEPEEVAGWGLPPSGWEFVATDAGPGTGNHLQPGSIQPGLAPGGFVQPGMVGVGAPYGPRGGYLPPGAYGGPPPSGPPRPYLGSPSGPPGNGSLAGPPLGAGPGPYGPQQVGTGPYAAPPQPWLGPFGPQPGPGPYGPPPPGTGPYGSPPGAPFPYGGRPPGVPPPSGGSPPGREPSQGGPPPPAGGKPGDSRRPRPVRRR